VTEENSKGQSCERQPEGIGHERHKRSNSKKSRVNNENDSDDKDRSAENNKECIPESNDILGPIDKLEEKYNHEAKHHSNNSSQNSEHFIVPEISSN